MCLEMKIQGRPVAWRQALIATPLPCRAPGMGTDRTHAMGLQRRRLLRLGGLGGAVRSHGGGDNSTIIDSNKDLDFRFPPREGLGKVGFDDLPTQGRAVVEGPGSTMVAERETSGSDLDYLSARARTPGVLGCINIYARTLAALDGARQCQKLSKCELVFWSVQSVGRA